MTGIVLQVRLDSSRLPNKALLPLDGKPLVLRVMETLNNIPANYRILACPEDSFLSLEPIAKEAGFYIFAGPKEDVLERFCQVIRHFSLTRIIRATGDNPFVFSDAAIAINSEAVSLGADYAGYTDLPYGAGVESVDAKALLRAGKEASSSYDREHVCPYLYNNNFKLHKPIAPLFWQGNDIRLTVDTQEDYEQARKLYSLLKDNPDKHHGSEIIKMYKSI